MMQYYLYTLGGGEQENHLICVQAPFKTMYKFFYREFSDEFDIVFLNNSLI